MGGGVHPRLPVATYQRIENFVTLQVSFLLHRLRTLLANDSGKRARVPARSTPTIRRAGLPSRRIVGTGPAPVLAVTPLRLGIAFASRVLRRRGEGERRGHPAPRQGACKAPWNPLLNGYEGERRGMEASQASLPRQGACKALWNPLLMYIFPLTHFAPQIPHR